MRKLIVRLAARLLRPAVEEILRQRAEVRAARARAISEMRTRELAAELGITVEELKDRTRRRWAEYRASKSRSAA